jgi:hypothetical protein
MIDSRVSATQVRVPVRHRVPEHALVTLWVEELFSEPAGTRTRDPYIKSVLLYQLSYRPPSGLTLSG